MIDETDRRINRAVTAVHNYVSQDPGSGDDRQEVLTDLLTDLQHYAQYKGLDFNEALRTARGHYQEEK